MRPLFSGIWQWSCFSQEKQLDFNGLYLSVGDHRILVDPPPMSDSEAAMVKRDGGIDYIIITNRDHEREAKRYQVEFSCQLYLPEADAPLMTLIPTRTFADGELLPGGIWVVHLSNQKSPGESALFLQREKGVLIVGDALIGTGGEALRMLPVEKYADAVKAREGLRRLLKYNFDALLVGDGRSILSEAKSAVARALQ